MRRQVLSLTFSRLSGRQYSPLPSMTPWPVMAMLRAPRAEMAVREEDDGSPFHLQADVGTQDDRSRVPDSCRYAQRAAALGGQVVDRRRESFGREAGTARIASEAGQRRFPFRDGRQRHLRHGERQFVGVVVAGRLRRGRCQRQCAQQQGRESFHACSNDCL